jgi:hypothetical protein
MIETADKYFIAGSTNSKVLLRIEPDGTTQNEVTLLFKPVSLTFFRHFGNEGENTFLVTYANTANNVRHIYDASTFGTSPPLVHTKSVLGKRDMASLYIHLPTPDVTTPVYFVLQDENIVEKVNAVVGTTIASYTLTDWTSVELKRGYLADIEFSKYVVAAREDEQQFILVSYDDTALEQIPKNSGMSEISGISIS